MLNVRPPRFADRTQVDAVPGRNEFSLCLAQWVSFRDACDLPFDPIGTVSAHGALHP